MDIATLASSLGVSAPAPAPAAINARVVVERLHEDADLTPQQRKALMAICKLYMSKTINKTAMYQRIVELVGKPKLKEALNACKARKPTKPTKPRKGRKSAE